MTRNFQIIVDFKFWMAHELAHVYTPDIAGSEAGEDFADALAGALLFPKSVAEIVYPNVVGQRSSQGEIRELKRLASAYSISLFSVFCEINHYAKFQKLPLLQTKAKDIHAIRNSQRGKLMSDIFFENTPLEPLVQLGAVSLGIFFFVFGIKRFSCLGDTTAKVFNESLRGCRYCPQRHLDEFFELYGCRARSCQLIPHYQSLFS